MVGFLTWVCQVLKAIHCGDSALFREHPELLDSIVRVYFHSSSEKYNRMECWGPLKDAMEVKLRHVKMNNEIWISNLIYLFASYPNLLQSRFQ